MTKLITILIAIGLLYGSYQLFLYWKHVESEQQAQQKATAEFNPDTLPGLPPQLEKSFQIVRQQGPAAMRNWLKSYGEQVQDPRRAWIELDFCVAIARDNPAEARQIFAGVKARTPSTSPVWPRVKELEKSFE